MQKSQTPFDVSEFISRLKSGKRLSLANFSQLCHKAKQLLVEEPSVVRVAAPIVICGDTHGQFYDLLEILSMAGEPPDSSYLFLGNYVNRGHHSVQVLSILLALKIQYPARVILLRGNHESRYLSQSYGFYDQCMRKYDSSEFWKLSTQIFDYLPLAALIEGQLFATHSGLSFESQNIDSINKVYRFMEVPHEGLISHLLSCCPDDRNGYNMIPKSYQFTFGPDITKEFNYSNDVKFIARSHQLVMKGYQITHDNQLATIFSSPNYCNRVGNKGAFMEVDQHHSRTFVQFDPSPKSKEGIPFQRIRNFEDIYSW